MNGLLAIAFALIGVVIFTLVKVRKIDVEEVTTFFVKNKTLKQLSNKKENRIIYGIKRVRAMLYATGQSARFSFLLVLSLALVGLGILTGIFLNNIFLVPIFGIAFGLLPFLYIQFQFIRYKHMVVDELETALSIVTSSYERSGNIMQAFNENIDYVGQPVKAVFEEFIFAVEDTNTNIIVAIDDMKSKIDHFVFIEWCDVLKRCSYDRALGASLRPVVGKLSEIKIVTGELHNILFSAKKTFFQLLCLSLVLLYIGFSVLPSGFNIPLPKTSSNLVLALNIALIIGVSIKAMIETKDVNFDI